MFHLAHLHVEEEKFLEINILLFCRIDFNNIFEVAIFAILKLNFTNTDF